MCDLAPPCAAASFALGWAAASGLDGRCWRLAGMWPARGEALMAFWALSAKEERKPGTGIVMADVWRIVETADVI